MLVDYNDGSANKCYIVKDAPSYKPSEDDDSQFEFFNLLIKLTLSCACCYVAIAIVAFWRWFYTVTKILLHIVNVYLMSLVMYITIMLTTSNGAMCCKYSNYNANLGTYVPALK